jgi:hypothetical protein
MTYLMTCYGLSDNCLETTSGRNALGGLSMRKLKETVTLRAIVLPLLGALGAIAAMVWPVGYQSFCSGMSGLVL